MHICCAKLTFQVKHTNDCLLVFNTSDRAGVSQVVMKPPVSTGPGFIKIQAAVCRIMGIIYSDMVC